MMNKKVLAFILLIIFLSIPALKALATPDFYTSHDGLTHTARIANYYLALQEGQIPPRLAPKLFGGLGYPIFVFIYPLPYLLASAFHVLGFSFTSSFEIVIGLSFVLSAMTMFLFTSEIFGKLPGFVAAIFYSWAPYRFSQLYVRGAIAESFAYVFVPLVLLSLHKLSKGNKKQWVGIGSLSLAGLLLSHQLVSLMFLPILVAFGLVFIKQATQKKSFFLNAALIAFIGFAASAFIYFPALFERKFLRFDELIDYHLDHFVTAKQLIHSPWSYGFSMPGTINDDMSFQVGLTHLLATGLAAIYVMFLLIKRKRRATQVKHFWIGFTSLALFAVSILLMLEHPVIRWTWRSIPAISVIDFPWRLLGVSVFSASLLASYLVKVTNNKLLLLLLLFFVFYANRNHLRINQSQVLDDEFFINYAGTATWRNEFLPKWRVTNKLNNIQGDYNVNKGDFKIEPIVTKTREIKLRIDAREEGVIDIQRLYFPGWRVFLDDKELSEAEQYKISKEIEIETETTPFTDRSGFMRIKVPRGRHLIIAQFSETPIRKIGFLLSILGFAISTIFLIAKPSKTVRPAKRKTK